MEPSLPEQPGAVQNAVPRSQTTQCLTVYRLSVDGEHFTVTTSHRPSVAACYPDSGEPCWTLIVPASVPQRQAVNAAHLWGDQVDFGELEGPADRQALEAKDEAA